jgi:hypothetical protein
MSWHGIGLISDSWTPLANMSQIYGPPLQTIEPSAAWTGTAGSGFASTPTDPARTTAKPAVRLLVPPFQYFTDTLDVGVIAMANDGGTLRPNFGIDNVRFLFEGNEATVTQPGFHTIQTQRGPRSYFGWWVRLKKPANTSGQAHLYIEATARDSSMQKRVIGPYLFSPNNVLYTHSVEVAPSLSQIPGQRYQTLNAAATWLNQQAAPNPLITITEAGFYELTVGTANSQGLQNRFSLPGRLNITASVPGVVIGRSNYTHDAAAIIDDGRFKLHLFGPNLTLDYRHILHVNGPTTSTDTGTAAWLDGVNMISTAPLGSMELWRGTTKPNGNGAARQGAWFTEVVATDITSFGRSANLIRGCDLDRVAYDIFSNARCCVNNIVRDHLNSPLSDEIDAFTVQYTGPAATATLTRTGGQGSDGGGVWIVNIGGTQYTFDTGETEGSPAYYPGDPNYPPAYNGADGVGGYWFSDVVNWLNGLPGITATLLLDENDPFQKRQAASGSLPGLASSGFTNQDIKSAPLTVVSKFNKHDDFYQHTSGTLENIIIAFNLAESVNAQLLFFAPSGIAGGVQGKEFDFFAVGNALAVGTTVTPWYDPSVALSQFGRGAPYGMAASHVVIAHNTLPNQGFFIRTVGLQYGSTVDAYCMIKNNVFRRLIYDPDGPFPGLTIDGLHIHSGNPAPQGATNVIVGGDQNTLFVDFANKNFRPAGLLAQNGFPPVLPHDIEGAAFPQYAALGAYALEAPQYVPPPPSTNPLADLLAAVNAAGGQSSVHRLRTATVSGGVWRSEDMSNNNNDLVQETGSVQPTIGPTGATFSGNQNVRQTITGGTFTVVMSFTKADASTNGFVLSDQASNGVARYTQGSFTTPGCTVIIDGNNISNRDAFYNALHQTGRKVVLMQSCDFTGDTQLRLGRQGGNSLAGEVDWFIVLHEAAFPNNLAQVRALAVQVATDIVN